MPDNIVTLTFNSDALTGQFGGTDYISGIIVVDYTTGNFAVSYSITGVDQTGLQTFTQYTDIGVPMPTTMGLTYSNGVYDIMDDNPRDLVRINFAYSGQQPTSFNSIGYYGSGANGYFSATNAPLQTNATACYCRDTLIRLVGGQAAVQDLAIGDLVVTASGEHRAIKWIGHRAYAGRFANANPHLLPICVKAGALADGVPSRDLWVSPKHALYLDGALIPAASLVNGANIVKAERVEAVEYWHVELDSHDVLVAENTPAESFVDDNGRGVFHNAHTFHELYPEEQLVEAVYCAPRLESGHLVAAVRRRLAARAGLEPAPETPFGELHGNIDVVDRASVAGWARDSLYPDAPVCLDVLVDGELVALAYADAHRPDLAAAGIGSGDHGFRVALPPLSEADHVIEVRRSADRVPLPGGPLLLERAARALAA